MVVRVSAHLFLTLCVFYPFANPFLNSADRLLGNMDPLLGNVVPQAANPPFHIPKVPGQFSIMIVDRGPGVCAVSSSLYHHSYYCISSGSVTSHAAFQVVTAFQVHFKWFCDKSQNKSGGIHGKVMDYG